MDETGTNANGGAPRQALDAGEERTRAIVEAALDCIITMDHEGTVVEFNPAAEQTFGYRRADAVGREMAALIIPPSLRDGHRAGLARYLATGDGPLLGTRLEITGLRADGTEFPVELTITRLPSDGPPLFAGFLRDISARQQTERRLAAQYAVSRILAEAAGVDEMAERVLAALGETMRWEVGAFWQVDPEREVLRCETAVWQRGNADTAEFAAATRAASFAPGAGLPGRVWADGQAVWVPDVRTLPNFPRCHAAQAQGIRAAFGFPIRQGEAITGVMEFFGREIRQPDQELLRVAETIGDQIGQFLHRSATEERLKERDAHLNLALDAARMGIWQWNVRTGGLWWSDQLEGIHGLAPGAFDGRIETFLRAVYPDDRATLTSQIEQALESGTAFAAEFRVTGPKGIFRWVSAEGSVFRDEAGRPVQVVGVATETTDRKRAEQELRARAEREALLNRIGQALRGSTDPDEIQDAAVAALGEALHVDRCYFARYDLAGDRITVDRDWRRPGFPSLSGSYRISDFGMGPQELASPDTALVVDDVLADSRLSAEAVSALGARGLRAAVSVGLFEGRRLAASLNAAMTAGPRAWTDEEVALVQDVATLTRSAMEAAQVQERERNIADRLQEALRPTRPGTVPGLDVDTFYHPALDEAKVGGDFYDVFALEEDCIALVVADLSGKGLAAAAQIATVRHMLRTLIYLRDTTLAESVTQLNDLLTEHGLLSGFATLFVGLFDARDRSLTYVSCGQEPGLLCRTSNGAVEEMEPTGPVLGGFAGAAFTERRVHLAPGDVMALFTDGLTEAGPSRKDLLGVPRMATLLRESAAAEAASAEAITARVVAGVEAFATRGGIRDDVCLLIARVK